MGLIDVSAKKKVGDETKEVTVQYDFGDNLEDAVERYGKEVVFTNFRANSKIVLQAGLRRCLEKGKDPAEFASRFKPGVQTVSPAVDPVTAAKNAFASMGEDERKAFLKELRAIK